MVIPAEFNGLDIQIGVGWGYDFSWADETGQIIDLSSYTAKIQFRNPSNKCSDEPTSDQITKQGQLIIELSTENGLITHSGTDLVLSIPKERTAALEPSLTVYDLFLTSPGGERDKLIYGSGSIFDAVTVPQ